MDVASLQEFLVLAQHLNFTAAAKECGVSQPTLSGHIAALERELGVELFDRDRQKVSLTPRGRALVKDANAVVGAYQGLLSHVRTLKSYRPERVRLMAYAGHRFVADSVRIAEDNLRKVNPLFEVEMVDMARTGCLDAVARGDVDACLLLDNFDLERPGLVAMAIDRDPLVAIVPQESALAPDGLLQASDLEDVRAFVPGNLTNHVLIDAVGALFAGLGVHPHLEECYFGSIEELYRLDFGDGVFIDVAHASASLPIPLARSYRVARFAEPELAFNDTLVLRRADEKGAVGRLAAELARVMGGRA